MLASARADPVDVINALRLEGCESEPAVGRPVEPDPTLDDVAHELSLNEGLEAALSHADYAAARSTVFHVRGSRADASIREILAGRYCGSINDARYEEIGVYGSGDETWIVLAVRQPSPQPLEPGAVAERVLDLVNEARAQSRRCGGEIYDSAKPLSLSDELNEAALAHARDMATRGVLTHVGSDGSDSGERIRSAGYAWHASGENVASGQLSADAVVAAWLASPGHCATLMGPRFTETGVAFALAPSKNPSIYWAQEFAAP